MTLTTLRPSSDVALVNTNSTAGDASSVLDDTPDADGSYVHAPDGKDINHGAARFRVNLTNLGAVSTTQRIKACRFRARIRLNASGGGRTAFVSADFRWVDSVNGTFNEKYGTSSSTTFATRTGNWRVAPPRDATTWQNRANKYSAPPEWTKSIVDRIHAYLQWFYASNATHVNCRLSELFVDVDIRDRGTLSTPVVTNFGTSTRPLVSWVFTENGDGDRQKKYRVKIFSAAQYGAAGFNENTSVPTWDSGVLSGTADGIAVGVDLRNGVTYKAFVAVAQDFNGRDWWTYQPYTNAKPGTKTSWATSTAFTITLEEPPTPTIVVTPDSSLPWLRNIIKVTAGINLLSANAASVETDATGWQTDANVTIAQSATQAAHGANSLRMTSVASGDMVAKTVTFPVKPGVQYTALASFRSAVSVRSVKVGIRWHDAAGASISTPSGSTVSDSTSGFTQASFTGNAPVNAVTARVVVFVMATGAANEVHYVDKASLAVGTSTTWTIGGLADQALVVVEYNWATIGQKNLLHEQLWSGGDQERNTNGYYLVSPTNNALAWDPSERYHGQGSIRWDVWDATSGVRVALGWTSGIVNLEPPYALAGVPARVYSFSIRMKSSTAITVRVGLQPIDRDGNAIGSSINGTATALTTAWQELKVQAATMPAGTVWVRPEVTNTNGTGSVNVWMDAPIWVLGSTVPAVLPMAGGSGIPADFKTVRGSDTESEATLITAASGDGGIYVFDQEVPPGYTVTYRAWTFSPEGEGLPALASPFSGYVQTMLDPPQEWILSTVSAFWVDRMLVDVSDITESQHKEQQAFFPLRPVMPGILNQASVVITDFIGGYDGTLTIGVLNEEDWAHLREIISSSVAFLIHPYHGARYVALLEPQAVYSGRTSEAHSSLNGETCEDTWRRTITVPFQEIGRPA